MFLLLMLNASRTQEGSKLILRILSPRKQGKSGWGDFLMKFEDNKTLSSVACIGDIDTWCVGIAPGTSCRCLCHQSLYLHYKYLYYQRLDCSRIGPKDQSITLFGDIGTWCDPHTHVWGSH
eukprot:sb/3476046/